MQADDRQRLTFDSAFRVERGPDVVARKVVR